MTTTTINTTTTATMTAAAGELVPMLKLAAANVIKSAVLPLNCLRIEASDGIAEVRASDGECTVSLLCDALGEFGPVLAPALPLLELVKALCPLAGKANKEVEVKLSLEGNTLTVHGVKGALSLELPDCQGSIFPGLESGDKLLAELPVEELRSGIAHCLPSVVLDSSTGTVHYTNGVLIEPGDNVLNMVSTTGHVLSKYATEGNGLDPMQLEQMRLETRATEILQTGKLIDSWLAQAEHDKRYLKKGHSTYWHDKYVHSLNMAGTEQDKLMAMLEPDWMPEISLPQSLVPGRVMQYLGKLLKPIKDSAAKVRIEAGKYCISFDWEGGAMSCCLLDVKFPPYERVIPGAGKIEGRWEVDRQGLAEACKLAVTVLKANGKLRDHNPWSRFTAGDSNLRVCADTSDGSTERHGEHTNVACLPAFIEGDTAATYLNPVYVQELIGSMRSETVILEFVDPVSPIVIRGSAEPGLVRIVMPVRMD